MRQKSETKPANYNPEGVAVGQEWESTDRRTPGRRVRVVSLHGASAIVEATAPSTKSGSGSFKPGRRTEVRLDRFRPTSTGWKLVT